MYATFSLALCCMTLLLLFNRQALGLCYLTRPFLQSNSFLDRKISGRNLCYCSGLDSSGRRDNNIRKNSYKNPHWNIWKTADHLEENGISSSSENDKPYVVDEKIIQQIVQILRNWGHVWAGEEKWQGILNKSTLLHEMEESIVALSLFMNYLDDAHGYEEISIAPPAMALVDMCSGKGIFSMLASYVFRNDNRVNKIVMIDKADIKWEHIEYINKLALQENRPLIEAWQGCNLHEIDKVVKRLESLETSTAIIGIHLCKRLSPTSIGIVNALGVHRCPFFALAPCCLPRVVTQSLHKQRLGKQSIMEIRQYESSDERIRRYEVETRRDAAMLRNSSKRPKTMSDNIALELLPTASYCWKCGRAGHVKANCPSLQITGKPQLIKPPVMRLDVSNILQSKKPFEAYCHLLSNSLQHRKVEIVDAGLINQKSQRQESNWNDERKSVFLVASAVQML